MGDEGGAVLPMPSAPDAIELRHLRAFVAVAEDLNFSRAASRLYITQPALSRQIRGLERLIGCDLFRRSTHGVELTPAGTALLGRSSAIIAELDAAISTTRSIGGEHAKRLDRIWTEFLDASGSRGDLAAMRAANDALHAGFEPPSGVELRSSNAGGVPSLLSVPPEAAATPPILFLHGGGHFAGSAFGYRHLSGALAVAAGRAVLVPEYRLAPEHPFPSSLEDAIRVYLAILDSGAVAEQIGVAGDSSGAGLAVSLLLALRDRQLPLPGRAVLMCPWLDLTGAVQRPPQEAPIMLTGDDARRYGEIYLAGHPSDDPLVNPLAADLSHLPRMLVQAGANDTTRPEAEQFVERARSVGVPVSLELYPVASHDFHLFWSFLPEAADALAHAGQFFADTNPAAQPARGAAHDG